MIILTFQDTFPAIAKLCKEWIYLILYTAFTTLLLAGNIYHILE